MFISTAAFDATCGYPGEGPLDAAVRLQALRDRIRAEEAKEARQEGSDLGSYSREPLCARGRSVKDDDDDAFDFDTAADDQVVATGK